MTCRPSLALALALGLLGCEVKRESSVGPPTPGPDPTPFELTGTWAGSWSSRFVPAGGIVDAVITQEQNNLTGGVTIGGSTCFSDGTLTGAFADESSFSIVIDTDASDQILFTGQVLADGRQVAGDYRIFNGTCSGDQGTWFMHLVALPAHAPMPITCVERVAANGDVEMIELR